MYDGAAAVSIMASLRWYSNNGKMIKPARPPVHAWGNTLTRNKTTNWSGLKGRQRKSHMAINKANAWVEGKLKHSLL